MSNATAITTHTNYEVVWGEDENDRALFVDYGDGSVMSRNARTEALSAYIHRSGLVALYVNGVLDAGHNFYPEA